MRLFFIPGFGEIPSIFDRIAPHLPGEKVFVDNWQLVGDRPRPDLTALSYARELTGRFGITTADVVIGHSMGGWIGLHLKHLTGCAVVQIGSWSAPAKVIRPVSNLKLVYWAVRRGLYFNRLVRRLLLGYNYRGKSSATVFGEVFGNLIRGDKHNVINQLRIIYSPVPEGFAAQPDLRLHARADTIIRYPDEPALEVPGDHFNLHTHPQEVYEPILAFLAARGQNFVPGA
ncbi:MAG: alpha/beta hydrolase [Cytophagales bacterium]|nr:alpha/beta hydrolase [Cytophagales bacterium]